MPAGAIPGSPARLGSPEPSPEYAALAPDRKPSANRRGSAMALSQSSLFSRGVPLPQTLPPHLRCASQLAAESSSCTGCNPPPSAAHWVTSHGSREAEPENYTKSEPVRVALETQNKWLCPILSLSLELVAPSTFTESRRRHLATTGDVGKGNLAEIPQLDNDGESNLGAVATKNERHTGQ